MRAALPLVALALLALTACGGEDARAPFTDSRPPPGLQHRFYPPQGWAWGLVRSGDGPPARYGVSAPAAVSHGQLLILTSYGEPAETWFETARELNGHGLVVWVLEPVGQGGSGRYKAPRDLGHAPSLDPDVANLLAFPRQVARSGPLYVLAAGTSSPVALRAAGMGLKADGVILSGPVLGAGDTARAAQMRSLGLGGLRAEVGDVWRRDGRDDHARGLTHDPVRGRLRQQWAMANPDLRMGGPSWGWRMAFADELAAARAADARVAAPVLVYAARDRAPCGHIPRCSIAMSGDALPAPHLEDDLRRSVWIKAVLGFVDPSGSALARTPPPVTLGPEG